MLDHAKRRAAVITAAALVPVAAVATFVGLHQAGRAELRGQLAAKVTDILQQSTPAEHHAHGHEFGDEVGRVICAVDPFGYDPPDATAMAQVKWVYARHMCAITGPGTSWAVSVRASGPIAVRLGDQPLVRVPTPGAGYPDRVRQAIPARYHDEAFADFADDDAIEAAMRRFALVQAR
jgi:hypothetical protein